MIIFTFLLLIKLHVQCDDNYRHSEHVIFIRGNHFLLEISVGVTAC